MKSINIKPKKWGNSLGIVLPKQLIIDGNISEGHEIEILILRKGSAIKKSFGLLKEQKIESSQSMKDRIRKDDENVLL